MHPSLEDQLSALEPVLDEALHTEIEALGSLRGLTRAPHFRKAVSLLFGCRGRIVVVGLGKSGLVAQRISASFRSTGTPSVYLHPVEAVHGDLGLVERGDVGLFFSKSGESAELLRLLPLFKRLEVPYVAVVCQGGSALERWSEVSLCLAPVVEAGPLKVVPTTSLTISQVVGNLLVIALYALRGTTEEDLAFLHPGGIIGRQTLHRVADLMHRGDGLPRVREDTPLREALVEMIEKKLGMTTVVDGAGRLTGVLTDGDLKRILHRHGQVDGLATGDVMTRRPRTIEPDAFVARAVERMENNPGGSITSLVVVGPDGVPEGVLHLHDCLRAGPSTAS